MRRSLRRSIPRYLITIGVYIFMILICIIISFLILKQIKNKYEIDIVNVKEQMQSNKIFAYEAINDIPSGHIITKENLNYTEIYSSQESNYYIKEEHIGMVSKIDIRKGTYILEDMVVEDMSIDGLREIEYDILFTNTNLNESDYVDIRILFPNGEDLIVLSKKDIKSFNSETGKCFFWLSEREILDMAGAVVDTYLFPGSKIYTTKYLEPTIQQASAINYRPNLSTLALMQKNTNILNNINGLDEILLKPDVYKDNQRFRKELEFRLEDFYSKSNYKFEQPIEGIGGNKEDMMEYGGA